MSESPDPEDHEPPDPSAMVLVRGGDPADPNAVKGAWQNAGDVHDQYGRYGICVAMGEGMTIEQAVRSKPLRNPRLLVTTGNRVPDGFEFGPEPGCDVPFAGIVWLPDREPETLQRLFAAFDAVDSPFSREERRDLP